MLPALSRTPICGCLGVCVSAGVCVLALPPGVIRAAGICMGSAVNASGKLDRKAEKEILHGESRAAAKMSPERAAEIALSTMQWVESSPVYDTEPSRQTANSRTEQARKSEKKEPTTTNILVREQTTRSKADVRPGEKVH